MPQLPIHQGVKTPSVFTVTVSDTRTEADDRSGALLRELCAEAEFVHLGHRIVPDDPERVVAVILHALDTAHADAVILSGGTGIAPRDQTYEAVTGLLDKTLDGFGEAFRRLSWVDIGPRAMLSRAVAGTRGRSVVVALPGSTGGVRLGMTELVVPVLGHVIALLRD